MAVDNKNKWKPLLLLGAIAPLVTILLYLTELLLISWENYPSSIEGWFALFNKSRLLALFYLNSLDIISIAVLGVMFLALFVLQRKTNPSLAVIFLPFAFLGIAVFLVPRTALFSLSSLSQKFLDAKREFIRLQLLGAGEAISSLGIPTIQTAGFFILGFASTLSSIIMLRGKKLLKATGIIGITAFILTFLDDISPLFFPSMTTPLLIIAGIFWVAWWILVSVFLFKSVRKKM